MDITPSIILTDTELAQLTGRKQPKRQMEWLSQNGWKFAVGADGLPKVARALFDSLMGVPPAKSRHAEPRLQFAAREPRLRLEGLSSSKGKRKA